MDGYGQRQRHSFKDIEQRILAILGGAPYWRASDIASRFQPDIYRALGLSGLQEFVKRSDKLHWQVVSENNTIGGRADPWSNTWSFVVKDGYTLKVGAPLHPRGEASPMSDADNEEVVKQQDRRNKRRRYKRRREARQQDRQRKAGANKKSKQGGRQ